MVAIFLGLNVLNSPCKTSALHKHSWLSSIDNTGFIVSTL